MQQQVPLIYFHGIIPGLYAPEWPVFIVGDDPARLTFTVSVDERMFAGLGNVDVEIEESSIRADMPLESSDSACTRQHSANESSAPTITTARSAVSGARN